MPVLWQADAIGEAPHWLGAALAWKSGASFFVDLKARFFVPTGHSDANKFNSELAFNGGSSLVSLKYRTSTRALQILWRDRQMRR
jgi:hypothetical protein